ncbi:MAG TPA: DUF4007 family protein [Symbiobacteriaceae bacterium]|jgi:hypothetical protein
MAISFASGFGFEPTWLEAALNVVADDPTIFQSARMKDAMSMFGIGNKKVEALCNWLRGMQLVTGTAENFRLSPLGRLIKTSDPRLRDQGTWWVLHFMLAIPSGGMSQGLWRWYANEPFPLGYSLDALFTAAARAFPEAKERTVRSGLDEVRRSLTASPLGSLGLMRPDSSAGKNSFRKDEPVALTLPVLLAGIAHQMASARRDTLNAEEIANLPSGAARVVNLPRSRLLRMLGEASARYGTGLVIVSQTAGLDSVWLRERSALFWLVWHYAEKAGATVLEAEASARRTLAEVEEAE